MGPKSQKLTWEKGTAKASCRTLIQKQQTIQRQFTAKRADSEILHRHKLSEGVYSERNIEKILVNIELIPRYIIPPCVSLPI